MKWPVLLNNLVPSDWFVNLALAENVKFGRFGDEIMSFKKFYKKLKKLSAKNETKDNYGFQEATYTELNALGVLPLDGITDPSQLESGEYLGIGEYNNNLVDTANI